MAIGFVTVMVLVVQINMNAHKRVIGEKGKIRKVRKRPTIWRMEGDPNNETLNHVQLEEHIMTTDFSNYTMSTKCLTGSHPTPQLAEDSAYSTNKTLSSPTSIINSSTSTHIHSKYNDFSSLDTSSSHKIKGFVSHRVWYCIHYCVATIWLQNPY